MENKTKQPEITCKRGFVTRDQIERYIANGDGTECNGCEKFTYSAGIGGCEYTNTRYHM